MGPFLERAFRKIVDNLQSCSWLVIIEFLIDLSFGYRHRSELEKFCSAYNRVTWLLTLFKPNPLSKWYLTVKRDQTSSLFPTNPLIPLKLTHFQYHLSTRKLSLFLWSRWRTTIVLLTIRLLSTPAVFKSLPELQLPLTARHANLCPTATSMNSTDDKNASPSRRIHHVTVTATQEASGCEELAISRSLTGTIDSIRWISIRWRENGRDRQWFHHLWDQRRGALSV